MEGKQQLIDFARRAVQTRSYSDEEGAFAACIQAEMEKLGYDEAFIDSTGNVVGRIGHEFHPGAVPREGADTGHCQRCGSNLGFLSPDLYNLRTAGLGGPAGGAFRCRTG